MDGDRREKAQPRRWKTTVPRLSRFALEHLLLLPIGTAIALVWANADPDSYIPVRFALSFWVNDVAMTFFFALITKEIVEATVPGGVLHTWRRALLPLIAAVGATVVPALIHIRTAYAFDEPVLAEAWPVTFAVDLAVCYFVARVIFRPHPVIPFLLLLGIASNVFGFLLVAFFSPTRERHLVVGGLIVVAGMAIAVVLRRARVKSFWPYLLAAGGVSWWGLFWSGIHPSLALIPIMPFLPHDKRDPGFFVDAPPNAKDTLSRFEIWWRYPAQVALFFFGLVNAGVPLGALEPGTWALPIAVLVGKPLGLLLAVGLAVATGMHLPHRVGWKEASASSSAPSCCHQGSCAAKPTWAS
jgi:Na+:H+ antiporter, NhaA family